jgi:hypothetical protein
MGSVGSTTKKGAYTANRAEPPSLGKVRPVCEFINAEATRLRHQVIGIGTAGTVGLVILFVILGIQSLWIAFFLGAGLFAFWFARSRAQLASSFSNIAMKRIASALGNLTYRAKSTLTMQHISSMDLFASGDATWTMRDEIAGISGDIRYSLHQARLAGRTKESVLFDGVIVRMDFREPFSAHTVVIPESDGQALNAAGSRKKKDLVMLKNPAFERMFGVYSTDYHEARRFVTPKWIYVALQATESLGKDLRFAFVQKSLFIAVPRVQLHPVPSLFGDALTPEGAVGPTTRLVGLVESMGRAMAEPA